LPLGFAGKVLGHRQAKRLGPKTLGPLMQVLGLKLLVIEDEPATARTLALRTPVQSNQQRSGNVSRLTPKLLPSPAPALKVVSDPQRRGSKYG
jgi:hypothetical protein